LHAIKSTAPSVSTSSALIKVIALRVTARRRLLQFSVTMGEITVLLHNAVTIIFKMAALCSLILRMIDLAR
jgi:hypothetical protein